MRRRPSWITTATSYEKVGSYETQFGMVAERDMAVAVFVLQALAIEGRAPGGRAQQEPARPHIAGRPGEVADALEPEHRIVDVEGDHRHVVAAVGGRSRDPGRDAPRLVQTFLEDLTLLILLVEHELIGVLGPIELADLAE